MISTEMLMAYPVGIEARIPKRAPRMSFLGASPADVHLLSLWAFNMSPKWVQWDFHKLRDLEICSGAHD